MDGIRRHTGARFPEDFALVGSDDIPEAAWASYDMTTVRQYPALAAKDAVAALDACMRADSARTQASLIDVTLIRRGTTDVTTTK